MSDVIRTIRTKEEFDNTLREEAKKLGAVEYVSSSIDQLLIDIDGVNVSLPSGNITLQSKNAEQIKRAFFNSLFENAISDCSIIFKWKAFKASRMEFFDEDLG